MGRAECRVTGYRITSNDHEVLPPATIINFPPDSGSVS